MSRECTNREFIEKLKKDEHDIRDDGKGRYEGVEFEDFIDKTTETRYRVYHSDIIPEPPPKTVTTEIVTA